MDLVENPFFILAALAWRAGCQVWSAQQFIIATPNMAGLSDKTVGIHFVASCRSKLREFLTQPASAGIEENAVVIRSSPARCSSPLRLLLEDVRKKLSHG